MKASVVGRIATACALLSLAAPALAGGTVSQEERDRYIFPLWGKALARKGIRLPLPWGVNLSNVYITQFLDLTDLRLSFGDDPLQPIEFIEFGDNRVWVEAINARLDLWVLPLLSVYYMGIFSPAGHISVDIQEPVEVPAGKDIISVGHGFGLTAVYGLGNTFVNADSNWAWVFPDSVEGSVQTWIFSARLGQTYALPKDWGVNFWTGVMYQKFGRETVGTVPIGEVLPPFDYDAAREDCAALGPVQGAACTSLVDRLEEEQPLASSSINYGITKGPRHPWNMVAGAQVAYGDHWYFRTEFGFLTKFSLLVMITYRFGIPFLPREGGRPEPEPEPAPEPPTPIWELPGPEPAPPPG